MFVVFRALYINI